MRRADVGAVLFAMTETACLASNDRYCDRMLKDDRPTTVGEIMTMDPIFCYAKYNASSRSHKHRLATRPGKRTLTGRSIDFARKRMYVDEAGDVVCYSSGTFISILKFTNLTL